MVFHNSHLRMSDWRTLSKVPGVAEILSGATMILATRFSALFTGDWNIKGFMCIQNKKSSGKDVVSMQAKSRVHHVESNVEDI